MKEIIEETVNLLKKGKVILYPTDTVWGIGCIATNSKAVQRIFKIKKRTETKSMIVLLDSVENLSKYVDFVPPTLTDVLDNYDKPVTVIYQNAKNLAKSLIPKDKTIAIRITRDPFCHEVVKQLGAPLVSTSANLSGDSTPLLFNKISDYIKESVDYIVDLQKSGFREIKPSTIIKISEKGDITILRD